MIRGQFRKPKVLAAHDFLLVKSMVPSLSTKCPAGKDSILGSTIDCGGLVVMAYIFRTSYRGRSGLLVIGLEAEPQT